LEITPLSKYFPFGDKKYGKSKKGEEEASKESSKEEEALSLFSIVL